MGAAAAESFMTTFAGKRDESNGGVSLAGFVERVNSSITARATEAGLTVEPELYLLTTEETIAHRLCSCPLIEPVSPLSPASLRYAHTSHARSSTAAQTPGQAFS